MRVSGHMFKKTPGLSEYSFAMLGISLTESSGLANFGFSGAGQSLSFTVNKGKLFDVNGHYVGSYNSGDTLSLSGNVSTGYIQYFVNGDEAGYTRKKSFGLEKFFVNTTGCAMDVFPSLWGNINLSNIDLEISPSFYAGTSLTGRVVNNAAFDFQVYSHRLTYGNASKSNLVGSISGQVLSNGSLPFTLYDSGSSEFSTTSELTISLDTSIGQLDKSLLVTRESNVTGDIFIVNDSSFASNSINVSFSGEAIRSSFAYNRADSGKSVLSVNYRKFDRTGLALDKSLIFSFKSDNPTGLATGTGTFITGYYPNASGLYSEMPDVEFSQYGVVTGTKFNPTNLFSLGCGSVIGVLFKNASGDGLDGSGRALLKSVNLPLYGSRRFYTITGVEIQNVGTGYSLPPYLDLLTGEIGPECFDVPRESGNSYIYSSFTGTGILRNVAAYLYGTPLTGVSVRTISGSPYTGFGITGMKFGNCGSGYSQLSGLTPRVSFKRKDTDSFLDASTSYNLDATGSFRFNQSGDSHSLVNNWMFETGTSLFALRPVSQDLYLGQVTGFSGVINLLKSDENFYTIVSYKQTSLDVNPSILASYRINGGERAKSVTINGQKTFSSYSGMLNKTTEVNSGVFIEF